MRARVAPWALLVAVAVAAAPASAQQPPAAAVAPELRADLILGHRPAAQLGAGVQIPVGYYVRIGVIGAVGASLASDEERGGDERIDGRVDLLARFLLDPFRQSAYGLSVGGGVSVRAEPGERARPLLLAAVDLELRRSSRGVAPAIQVGLGGGVRIGVILRRAASAAR